MLGVFIKKKSEQSVIRTLYSEVMLAFFIKNSE